MADDPRYDAATAVTGAAMLGGGGTLRHHAIRRAYPKGKQPKIHALSMLRRAPKGKKQFWAGSAIGALGLPPLALGTTRLARGDVDKAAKERTPQDRAARLEQAARRAHMYSIEQARAGNLAGVRRATRVRNARAGRAAMLWSGVVKADDPHKRGFWREGLRGTKEALGQRADSYRQPVPAKLRAAQLGVGAATGAVGSVVARAALGRRGDALKPFITPIAGGLSATGSVPLTNRVVHSRYPDYEVTPSGVRRKKKPIVMPSKMASRHRGTPRSLRQDVNKSLLGGVWKPASRLTSHERHQVLGHVAARRSALYKPGPIHERGRPASLDPLQADLHAIRHAPTEASSHPKVRFGTDVRASTRATVLANTPRKLKHPIVVHETDIEHHSTMSRRGSTPATLLLRRRSGFRGIMDEPISPHIYRHELAHSQAKRNLSGRLKDDPRKGIREEARADAEAQRHHPSKRPVADYELNSILRTSNSRGIKRLRRNLAPQLSKHPLTTKDAGHEYKRMRQHLGQPIHSRKTVPNSGFLSPAEKENAIIYGPPIALAAAGTVIDSHHKRKARNRAKAQSLLAKADDKRYLGARTPYATQRAVTTASTHTPVIGPFVSAGTAARYAPPGQGRKAAVRQWGMSSGVGIPAGIAGAYGGAHLANRSDKAHHAAQTLVHTKDKVEGKARSMVGLKDKTGKGPLGRGVERFVRTKAGKPFRTPRGAIGGAAGMVVARGIAGGIGDQAAITMNQNAQRRYNKVHHIEKAAGQTKREKHDLATQKRRTAALSTASGLLGLGSLGLIATGHRNAAVTTGILGSGIGGTNSLLGARVQRKEAQNVDPVKKRYDKSTGHWDIPKNGLVQMVGSGGKWSSGFKDRENPLLGVRYVDPEDVHEQEWTRARLKAHAPFKPHRHKVRARTTDPKLVYRVHKAALEIKGSDRDHHDMIRRYGDRGPLPKGLSREDRMKAYEARYVHHGGEKQNVWSRRAATGNALKNAGVGVGTAGGAAWLATRGKSGLRRLAKHPNLARHAETTAVAGATIGGAGEMLAGYAHRRQASYANSPGGVAASALRRMRAYTPETT